MDWNLKAPAWDLTEFEQAAYSGVQGSSSSGDNNSRGDFSIDLKLGRVANFAEEMVDKWKEPRLAKMAPLASGSNSKRARATSNATQAASCLVDGCNSDLSNCNKEYHRRHKVCEIHSKTPEVTIGGHKQRFCQQCSRFHSLEEFDEGKRSCRKRLDGHNRRRRKPQPEPMSRVGSFLSNYQGGQLIPFSSTQVYPSTNVMNPGWAVAVSSEEAARQLYNQQQHFNLHEKQSSFMGSSSSSYNKEVKQFTALEGDNLSLNNQASRKTSICQPLLMSIALPESGGHNMFCDRLTNAVPYGDCALSLLSSPQSQTSGISVQPSALTLHDHDHDHGLDSVLVSSGREGHIHYPPSFHLASHDSPPNNVSQTLPFHWD